MRILLSTSSGKYTARREQRDGRDYLVVPVVAMVEGVVHAVNSEFPELVTAGEYSRNVEQWNERPLFHGHPVRDGEPVPSDTEGVMDEAVGVTRAAEVKNGNLTMEAWLDIEKTKAQAPRLLERAEAGDAVEISIGGFVDVDDSAGTWRGKTYRGAWTNLRADHLALLPEGDEGACSRQAGCGIRAAAKKGTAMKKIDTTQGGAFVRLMESARRLFRGNQDAAEMSSNDLTRRLFDKLREIEPDVVMVDCYHPVSEPTKVVYSVQSLTGSPDWGGYDYKQFERDFELSTDGVITLGTTRVQVEPVVYYEPVNPEDMRTACGCGGQKNAAAGAPCSCSHEAPITGDTTMKREDVAAFLKDATAEDLKALGVTRAASEPAAPTTEPVVEKKTEPVVEKKTEAAAPAAATEKPTTFEDVMASAPADVREAVEGATRAAAAKKADTIKVLKASGRNPFSDAELGKMSQTELDRLVTLAGQPRQAVDFSGQGGPKVDAPTEAPPAPDMTAALKAAQAARKK